MALFVVNILVLVVRKGGGRGKAILNGRQNPPGCLQ